MRVPTLTETFRFTRSTFCDLMIEVILVRCSLVSFAVLAAPWPVVARFCSLPDLFEGIADGLWSDLLFAPSFDSCGVPPGPRCPISDFSDFGDWPVVSLPDLPDLPDLPALPSGVA